VGWQGERRDVREKREIYRERQDMTKMSMGVDKNVYGGRQKCLWGHYVLKDI